MVRTTPIGTRTWAISRPFGRRQALIVSPTGSGRAAISSSPRAIASMRSGVSVRRSRKAALSPAARVRSTSARLASSNASRSRRSADAWRWQYVQGEHRPIIILADDGGRICGYYHAVLFTMRYNGRRAIASMEQDVATLRAYRGQGVFAAMTKFLDERKKERGIDF